jgi:hypothetical protein
MARRGSDFHFARYHFEDERDCEAFQNAFASLLKQIPLQVDHDALIQRWWYFFEGSIGCIGILKQWLVRALYRALREGSPELTRAHLEKAVLPDAKWERMRADAQSGEAEFRYAEGQNSYLSELASMPTFAPSQADPAPPSPSTPSPEDETAGQKKSKLNGHVGEPSPRRDQVGTALPEGAIHALFVFRPDQAGDSSLAGIESPGGAMSDLWFGEQSQAERAICGHCSTSPTQVAAST